MPMDDTLLGSPWPFKRRVTHDGRMNTYTFTEDHKNMTLTPLISAHSSKIKQNPQMDIFLTTLLRSQLHEFKHYKEWILLG